MALITFKKNDKNISSLVKRLYPGLDNNKRKQVEVGILKENPHLAEVNAVRPGVVVKLPELPEITAKPETDGLDPVADVQEQLLDAVKDYQKVVKAGMAEAEQAIELQRKMLHADVVQKAIGAAGQGAQQLAKELEESLKERLATHAEEKKVQREILNKVVDDLQAMSGW